MSNNSIIPHIILHIIFKAGSILATCNQLTLVAGPTVVSQTAKDYFSCICMIHYYNAYFEVCTVLLWLWVSAMAPHTVACITSTAPCMPHYHLDTDCRLKAHTGTQLCRIFVPENTYDSPSAGTMPGHRLRRWPGIVPALGESYVFSGVAFSDATKHFISLQGYHPCSRLVSLPQRYQETMHKHLVKSARSWPNVGPTSL